MGLFQSYLPIGFGLAWVLLTLAPVSNVGPLFNPVADRYLYLPLIGIAFSLFVVVIAALNLVLDFDFIEKGAEVGAPKYMEWYGAFGLVVTLIWIYLEILRLLSKLYGRR